VSSASECGGDSGASEHDELGMWMLSGDDYRYFDT
jgi:hypothetical protein